MSAKFFVIYLCPHIGKTVIDMIVGLLNDSFPPMVDGVSRVLINYANELTRIGDRAVAMVPYFPGISQDHYGFEVYNFRSHYVPTRREYRWGIAAADFAFRRSVNDIPFDILHAHCPFSTYVLARKMAKSRNIPLVSTFHTKYRDDFKEALKMDAAANFVVKMIVKAYDSADEVWTVNDASIETLRSYGFKGKIVVMPNGCDIEPCERSEKTRRAILSEYALPDMPLLTFVGRLVPQKNLPMLMESLKILRDSGGKFSALIVGEGDEKESLEQAARDFSLGGQVKFAGAVRDRQKLKNIYLSSAAALLPSMYDTSSLVPREAAACLCPTLFALGSSTAQGITDGENGYLAAPTPEATAKRLLEILKDPQALEKTSRGARDSLYRPWSQAVAEARERYVMLIDKKKSRK